MAPPLLDRGECRTTEIARNALAGRVRVLCVDDDPLVLELLSEDLAAFKLFACDCVADAAGACRRIAGGGYHACLSDLGLRGLGRDQLELFRRCGHRLPMFAVSGRGEMGLAVRCVQAGAVDVIDKCRFHEPARLYDLLMGILVYGVLGHGGAFRDPKCRRALDMLMVARPREVRDWARALGEDERELRRMLKPCVLKTCHLQKLFLVLWPAFDHHWRQAKLPLPPNRRNRCAVNDHRRAAEYFLLNRSLFERLLSPVPLYGAAA